MIKNALYINWKHPISYKITFIYRIMYQHSLSLLQQAFKKAATHYISTEHLSQTLGQPDEFI